MKRFVKNLYVAVLDLVLAKYLTRFLLNQHLIWGDPARVQIAATAKVHNALFNVMSGSIRIEEYVFFGNNVSVLTGTHDYTCFDAERQNAFPRSGRNIVVKRGAWIASNVTILGPCTIGEHAVIAAGAVVTKDVSPYTVVAGVPAKPVSRIPQPTT